MLEAENHIVVAKKSQFYNARFAHLPNPACSNPQRFKAGAKTSGI